MTDASPVGGCGHRERLLPAADRTLIARGATGGVILDLDDTIYPREEYVQSGLMAVARHLEARYAIPALDAFAGMCETSRGDARGRELQAVCARFSLPHELVPELLEVLRAHRPVLRLPRASAAALRQLRASGWRTVVLADGRPDVQRAKVAALRVEELIDGVVYAEEHAEGGKPAPAAFRAALRVLGVSARRAVCVGDDPRRDVAGARALGIRTIRVRRPGIAVSAGAEADIAIDSLDALPAAVVHLMDPGNADAA